MLSITYQADYGEAYIVIPPSQGSLTSETKTSVEVACQFTQCMRNSYLENDSCTKCPSNSHAPQGSTTASSCTSCIDGFTLTHELDSECSVSQDYKKITSSIGWRVWTTDKHTDLWYSWDISEIEFYETIDCSGEIISNSDTYVESGSAHSYYGPHQAFGGDGIWGGRRDSDNLFYIGMMYDSEVQLKCVKLFIADSNKWTSEVRIQA